MGQRKRKPRKRERTPIENSVSHADPAPQAVAGSSWISSLVLIAIGGILAALVMMIVDVEDSGTKTPQIKNDLRSNARSVWELLALSDDELENVDVVEMNVAVAREIPGLQELDYYKYKAVVDGWAEQVEASLPEGEAVFNKTPEQWKNDIHFFRLGQGAAFLSQVVGIKYIEEQKNLKTVRYEDSADLFLHGLIDKKVGTCGNMPILHVALGRRLGWPVSLSSVRSHTVCRFDDGKNVYNIEATDTDKGGMFSAGTDAEYVERFQLPSIAKECGSDLNRMSAREMLGYFITLRARHFADTGRMDLADRDYSLARSLIPNHRRTYMASMEAAVAKGEKIFALQEVGHPRGLANHLQSLYSSSRTQSPFDDVERINEMNARMYQKQVRRQNEMFQPSASTNTSMNLFQQAR